MLVGSLEILVFSLNGWSHRAEKRSSPLLQTLFSLLPNLELCLIERTRFVVDIVYDLLGLCCQEVRMASFHLDNKGRVGSGGLWGGGGQGGGERETRRGRSLRGGSPHHRGRLVH